jgi:hypothetical protein
MANTLIQGFESPIMLETPGIRQFAYDSPSPQTLRLDLSVARTTQLLSLSGTLLWIYQASDKDAVADIRFNSNQANSITFREGQGLRGLSFRELYVSNTAQAGKYLDIMTIVENLDVTNQKVEFVNPGATFANVDLTKPTSGNSETDVTITAAAAAAIILAANATRRKALVTSLTTNTQEVRIGVGVASAVDTGTPIQPGESVEIDGTVVLYGYTGAGVDQVVAISWVAD